MKVLHAFLRAAGRQLRSVYQTKNVTKNCISQFLATATATPTAARITKIPSYITESIT